MSGTDVAGIVDRIDASIEDNDKRVQTEVAAYIAADPRNFVGELIKTGYVLIPTFSGSVKVTKEEIEAAVKGLSSSR